MKKNREFVWGICFMCVYCEVVKPDHGMLRDALVRFDKNTVVCLDNFYILYFYHLLQLAYETRRF